MKAMTKRIVGVVILSQFCPLLTMLLGWAGGFTDVLQLYIYGYLFSIVIAMGFGTWFLISWAFDFKQ